MTQLTKSSLLHIILLTLLGAGLGAAMILISPSLLLWLASVLLGLGIILSVLPELFHEVLFWGEEPLSEFVFTLITLIVGILLIFWHNWVLMLIVGVLLIALPCYRIATALSKQAMFKNQLPVLILGIVLLFVGPARFLNLLFDIGGWIIIVLSVLYLISSIILLAKAKPIIIEATKTEIEEDK